MKRLIFIILLLGSMGCAQDNSKPLIMVHYMPWYQTPSIHGYWGYHWTMNHFNPERIFPNGSREIASQYYPLTGPYDSDDKLILEYQTLLMKISGIDGVLVDWYGMDDYMDYGTLNESTKKLFTAIQKSNLLFAIVYEDQTIKHMIDGGYLSSANAISYGKSVMKYLQDNWYNNDEYLKLNGHPVLLNFGPQYFLNSSSWSTLFSELTIQPYFFTLDTRLYPAAVGTYPWPPMWKSGANGILTQSALNDYLIQFYQKTASYTYRIASAFPGFYDIYQQAGVGDSYGYLDSQNGQTFKSTLQKALDSNPDIIQIVTWNDYGEGTIIEPTTLFGNKYLEIVQSIKDSLDATFNYQKSDLNIPLQIYNFRKQYAGDQSINTILDRIFNLIVSNQRDASVVLMDSLLSITEVNSSKKNFPEEYLLTQNFPNPFNPNTIISYQLPVSDWVSLKVFDITGKEIATLVNEEKLAGFYRCEFDGSKLTSGIYFYQLKVGNFVETKKLILMK
jgi:hypothetical protein